MNWSDSFTKDWVNDSTLITLKRRFKYIHIIYIWIGDAFVVFFCMNAIPYPMRIFIFYCMRQMAIKFRHYLHVIIYLMMPCYSPGTDYWTGLYVNVKWIGLNIICLKYTLLFITGCTSHNSVKTFLP